MFFGAILNSIPSIFVGLTFGFWWVLFFEANFNSITSNFFSRTLIMERFWSDFEFQPLQFGVHILVQLGEYSLERISSCKFLIDLSSCSCFVSGLRMSENAMAHRRDFQLMGEVAMRARRS